MILKKIINFNGSIIMLVIKILSALTFMGSIFWFIAEPDYEPAIVAISSLSGFILLWRKEKKTQITPLQNQSVAENGFGIQAKGNVNICNVNMNKEKSENAK